VRKSIKGKEMTSTQRFLLAYQTCQWWNAVFIQADRFFDVLEKNHGGTPWDNGDANSLFPAERLFLITAIFHAIENLEKMDIELQRKGDNSFHQVLEAIEKVSALQDIKDLRDMNEHNLDYLMKEGYKQSQFQSSVEKDGNTILTSAAWTHVNHDVHVILFGNVEIDTLLFTMKEYLPFVQSKTKEVFENELIS
jgi:hypothetical protein